jgi:membrane-associated protease RseP (regulator of RpoE activity)
LAGFAFVLPALWIGLALSRIVPKGSISGGLSFGEPLILRWSARLLLGYAPASQDLLVHPIAMAAWFGLLATSLNLLPIWQLDGGHIAYAVFGRSAQRRISIGAAIALVLLSFLGWPTPSYLLFALLLLVIGLRVRFYHPSTLHDEEELGPGRIFLGLVAAVILILSFIPVPISLG